MRIAFLGPPEIKNTYLRSTQELFKESGHNTGNQLFRYTLGKHILNEKEIIFFGENAEEIGEKCDLILIPSANQIHPGWDLQHWADYIEKTKLPTLAIGLGAQNKQINPRNKVKLKKGTLRYLKILSERSTHIGVRGAYSLEQLHHHGINNGVITGCPSNFINPNKNLGQQIADKLKNRIIHKLAVSSAHFDSHALHQKVEKFLLELVIEKKGAFICQSDIKPLHISRNDPPTATSEKFLKTLWKYFRYHKTQTLNEFTKICKQHFITFYNTEPWLDFLSTFDLNIGKRIHGNICAMQAGIPGILIPHDSRTEELGTTLKLPMVPMQEFGKIDSLESLLDKVTFDGVEYDNNRDELWKVYEMLLKENNLNYKIM